MLYIYTVIATQIQLLCKAWCRHNCLYIYFRWSCFV